jgi:crotonobetainyl-CoA:carnitine CoA-transferase CaiB-like acyl-CoA transferase
MTPPAHPTDSRAPAVGALSGVRVIDLTRVFAGPMCTQLLGDHGADVIKIEPPQGDETRDWGVPGADDVSSYFWGLNRSKRTLALDLRLPAARSVLLRLLDGADVLVDNFKAGTLEAWGLGFDDVLGARFARLVHLTISGYGRTGPLAGQPGYDAVAQAVTGVMSVNGESGGAALKLPLPLVDMTAGVYACAAIAMALLERARSGRGQHIDVALYDVGLSMTHPLSTAWQFDGRTPQPVGNAYASLAPYGVYAAADRDLFIGVGNHGAFRKLCAVLGCAGAADDPRFATNRLRVQNRAALDAAIGPLIAARPADALAAALMDAGVAAGPVQDMAQAFQHPQTQAAGMWPALGPHRVIASPMKLNRTPPQPASPAAPFGRDADAVLGQAGYDAPQIAALEQQGALVRQRRS